jgi:hypothetical protein
MACSFAEGRVIAPGLELCDVREAGLSMALRLQSGDGALILANARTADGATREQIVLQVPSAMLPDPHAHPDHLAEAPTVGSLVAWTYVRAGQALLAVGDAGRAEGSFRRAVDIEANWPPTAKDRQTLFVPVAWARLGLARVAYAKGDYETAFRLLQERPWGMPKELEDQIKQLTDDVSRRRRR